MKCFRESEGKIPNSHLGKKNVLFSAEVCQRLKNYMILNSTPPRKKRDNYLQIVITNSINSRVRFENVIMENIGDILHRFWVSIYCTVKQSSKENMHMPSQPKFLSRPQE